MPTLYVTIGLPASGKTSWAHRTVKINKNAVAISYDDVRQTLKGNVLDGANIEGTVRTLTVASVRHLLGRDHDVVVHNTTLGESAQNMWKELVDSWQKEGTQVKLKFKDFRTTPVADCISRDELRVGDEQVGHAVIWNMALAAGLLRFDSRPIVIVDVDGTLADHTDVRSPYDESKVHLDKPYPVVVQWVKNLVHWTGYCMDCFRPRPRDAANIQPDECQCFVPRSAPEYQVIVVSGRSTKCAKTTYTWLRSRITFEYLFMRNRGDRRPDTEVKQEILNRLLKLVPKEQIAFVIDDRPCVVQMWKSNGLTVYPVRGQIEEF